ncbi:MAG: CBS domain-containing protein [Natrialbaceae archaeon]|nr:CBS domain-containing protein [Natrialbaceae archaeon]
MEDVFVARLMSTDVRDISEEATVAEAGNEMVGAGIGSLLILDGDGALTGILTSTDFVRMAAEGVVTDETTVSRYMSGDVITVGANTSVKEVAALMTTYGVHHIPVVDDSDGPIGMVTSTDLTGYVSGGVEFTQ